MTVIHSNVFSARISRNKNARPKCASVSHDSAIGDTISCNAPYSAIGFRGKFQRSGGVASIVCDTTGNTVRHAIGFFFFGPVTKQMTLF